MYGPLIVKNAPTCPEAPRRLSPVADRRPISPTPASGLHARIGHSHRIRPSHRIGRLLRRLVRGIGSGLLFRGDPVDAEVAGH